MKKERETFFCKKCNKPFSFTKEVANLLKQGGSYSNLQLGYCKDCLEKRNING